MGILRYETEPLQAEKFINRKSAHLVYISTSRYEEDWNSICHSHSFAELFYVVNGSGSFLIEDIEFPVTSNDMVIINPQIAHTETSYSSHPLEYITLGIQGISFSFDYETDYALFHCGSLKKELSFYFSTLLSEYEKKEAGYEQICQNLLEVLLLQLSRLSAQSFEVVVMPRASRECSKIKRYIDANYASDLSLESLAAMAHLNKYYFAHSFAKAYGTSPMNYLTSQRLAAAKELLETTDYSIAEIARISGFSSQSYFSQAFRRQYGITAGKYRISKK